MPLPLYQAPDNRTVIEVRFEGETIWLTQAQIVTLFSTSKANVSEHIKQIYQSKELEVEAKFGNSEQFTSKEIDISNQLKLDLKQFNAQYPAIGLKTFTKSHDRFLIIDNH